MSTFNLPPGCTTNDIEHACGGDIPDGYTYCEACGDRIEIKNSTRRDTADGSEEFLCGKCAERFNEVALEMYDRLVAAIRGLLEFGNVERRARAELTAAQVITEAKWPR